MRRVDASFIVEILTAELASERDRIAAMTAYARRIEGRVRLYEPLPEIYRLRAECGVTAEMLEGT